MIEGSFSTYSSTVLKFLGIPRRLQWNCYISISLKLARCKSRPKRSQHSQYVATLMRAFGHRVAMCWVLVAQVWKWSKLSQQHPACCNTSQHGGQTHETCWVQQCCDMLRMLRSFGRGLRDLERLPFVWKTGRNFPPFFFLSAKWEGMRVFIC